MGLEGVLLIVEDGEGVGSDACVEDVFEEGMVVNVKLRSGVG